VICGPRLSPVVRAVLQSDPVLGFDQDDDGRWLLQDRRTGEGLQVTCDLDHPGTPSATVAILREQPDTIDYLVLGDTRSCWSSRLTSG
jgi:hypothetical protein